MARPLALVVLLSGFLASISLPTLASGAKDFDLRRALERPGVQMVVVDVYATWCEPCMKAMPRWQSYGRPIATGGSVLDGPHPRCSGALWDRDQ